MFAYFLRLGGSPTTGSIARIADGFDLFFVVIDIFLVDDFVMLMVAALVDDLSPRPLSHLFGLFDNFVVLLLAALLRLFGPLVDAVGTAL